MRWCVRNEERRGEERERTLSLGWPPHCSSSFGFHSLFSSLLCAPLSCFPVPPLSSPSLCSLFSIVILSQPQTRHCCVVSCCADSRESRVAVRARSYYMRQVLEAVRTAHAQRPNAVVLRSLRPHCLVLASHANSAPLKITAFAGALHSLPPHSTANGPLRQPPPPSGKHEIRYCTCTYPHGLTSPELMLCQVTAVLLSNCRVIAG